MQHFKLFRNDSEIVEILKWKLISRHSGESESIVQFKWVTFFMVLLAAKQRRVVEKGARKKC
jgi:hypothetical protein